MARRLHRAQELPWDRSDTRLGSLRFLVGPNGAGKSSFLDALAFLRDATRDSLDHAIRNRGGIIHVRRRSRGRPTHVGIEVRFALPSGARGQYGFRIAAKSGGGYAVQRRVPGLPCRGAAGRAACALRREERPCPRFVVGAAAREYGSPLPCGCRGAARVRGGLPTGARWPHTARPSEAREYLRSRPRRHGSRPRRCRGARIAGVSPARSGRATLPAHTMSGRCDHSRYSSPSGLVRRSASRNSRSAATAVTMREATESQVIVTSHSPDLLDTAASRRKSC